MGKSWAVVTGASGGMGMEISRAVLKAGYPLVMACRSEIKTSACIDKLRAELPGAEIEFSHLDLSSMDSVCAFAQRIGEKTGSVSLLMNNAGTMETGFHRSEDGFENTVSVNYLGPYLLSRKLLPFMEKGARIVNMVSCTYAVGHLEFPIFFYRGKRGRFSRIPIYSNTKLALTLFTLALSERCREKGICVNAADPGIVSTEIIRMHKWFDPLTDLFFRPVIRTPEQGAATAVRLLLSEECAGRTGEFHASCHVKRLPEKYYADPMGAILWNETEKVLARWLGGC